MLTELSIENFAIIDNLLVRFEPGFTVITGETGAGKSIIIDALQASLGARVSSDVVRSGARYAAVEAVFDLRPTAGEPALSAVLAGLGIERDEILILRREISAAGRGTGRVNGRAVPLAALSSLGALLVDIHGQSDHLSVLRRDHQLEVLDRFGDVVDLRRRVAEEINKYNRLRREAEELEAGRRTAEQRLDLLRFQVGEIESAALRSMEEDDLVHERTLLGNAERLAQLAATARDRLHDDASAMLAEADHALREIASIDAEMAMLSERLAGAQVEIDDIAQDLRRYGDAIEYDPARLAAVEERLDLIHRLKRKYGSTVKEIIEFGQTARADLESIEQFDDRLADLHHAVQCAELNAGQMAEELSLRRARAADHLALSLRDALQGLGLRDTECAVELTQTPDDDGLLLPGRETRFGFNASGVDAVTFLVSFNQGEPLRPLDKVASGGETSRFLLALKSVLAGADPTPTLVFDEVDVGVGARHGAVVGERLRALAGTHQVLSITHLPQVAALGDHHLTVSKVTADGRTFTAVQELEHMDRVVEIAEMMSGTGTETARRNAAELLEAAQNGRTSTLSP